MNGLGKTIITLSAIYQLKYNYFQVKKVLIIAPKKVAEATWQREAAKWDGVGILRISTVLGPLKKQIHRRISTSSIVRMYRGWLATIRTPGHSIWW